MTSCGGTSMTIVRRLTRTILSIGAKTRITPGPLRLRQQLAEPEDDAALVLGQDLDRAEQVQHDDEGEQQNDGIGMGRDLSDRLSSDDASRTRLRRGDGQRQAVDRRRRTPRRLRRSARPTTRTPDLAVGRRRGRASRARSGSSARAAVPIMPADPVAGRRRCDGNPEPHEQDQDRRQPGDDRQDHRQADLQLGRRTCPSASSSRRAGSATPPTLSTP